MTSKRAIPARSNFIVVGIVTLGLVAATFLAVDPQRSETEALVLPFFAAWFLAGAIVGRWGFLFAFLIWPLTVSISGDEPAGDQPLWVLSAFSSLIVCLPLLALGTLLRRLVATRFGGTSR